ncbi:hypothetical protein PC116_g12999 [Phytophthora cactorum]|nr:hypothetical protein PC116_g12999 [Phytophthora cactorum]
MRLAMMRVATYSGRFRVLSPLLKGSKASSGRQLPSTWSSRAPHARRRHYSSNKPTQTPQHTSTPDMSEPEMVMRLMRSQRVWWWMGSLVLGGVGLVAFGPELKLGMSKHTAEVASRSLQDETLRDNTRDLASQIVQTVLNDPKVLDQASRFLQRLVVMESTREALQALVIHTLNDPMTRTQVADLTKHTVAALLEDPKTLRQLVDLLRSTVVDPQAKEALLLLLEQIMRDEQTRANLTQLLAHTFLQDAVKQNVTRTLGDSVHDVLSRRDIQNHAKEFVSGVVRDQTVQAQSGDAIWGTFMYALTPTWLSWIWENPKELAKDKGATTPAAEAAKVMVAATAAEDKLEKQKKEESEKQELNTATAETKDTLSPLQLKKKLSRKSGGSDQDNTSPKRTKTKRMTTPHAASKDTKSVDPAKTASSHADFAERYEDRHWSGSGSGFLPNAGIYVSLRELEPAVDERIKTMHLFVLAVDLLQLQRFAQRVSMSQPRVGRVGIRALCVYAQLLPPVRCHAGFVSPGEAHARVLSLGRARLYMEDCCVRTDTRNGEDKQDELSLTPRDVVVCLSFDAELRRKLPLRYRLCIDENDVKKVARHFRKRSIGD